MNIFILRTIAMTINAVVGLYWMIKDVIRKYDKKKEYYDNGSRFYSTSHLDQSVQVGI